MIFDSSDNNQDSYYAFSIQISKMVQDRKYLHVTASHLSQLPLRTSTWLHVDPP